MFTALRRFPLIVIAAIVIAALIGALITLLIPAKYTATAQVVIGNPNDATVFRTVPILNANAAAQDATQIMRSQAVYDRASELLDHKLSSSAVGNAVSVTPGAEDAPMVTIKATRGSAKSARDVANAEGQAYLDVTKAQTSARASRARAALLGPEQQMKAQLATLNDQLKTRASQLTKDAGSIVKPSDRARYVESALNSDPRYQSLQSQANALVTNIATVGQTIQETEVDASLSESGVDTLYGASLPSNPRRTDLARNIVIAAVLGLLIGAAIAWRRLDRERGTDRNELATVLDAPLLGTMRASRELAGPTQVVNLVPGNPIADDFRVLASTLILDVRRRGLRSCVFTSIDVAAGKTVIALNVAAAADSAGYDVVLIDGDARNPTLTSGFGLEGRPGLYDAMSDAARPDTSPYRYAPNRALRMIPVGSPGGTVDATRLPDLGAGTVAIIDAPPFFADPLPLVLASDGAGLVVVVSKHADPEELRALRMRAESAGATVLGFLVNDHATQAEGRHASNNPVFGDDQEPAASGPANQ